MEEEKSILEEQGKEIKNDFLLPLSNNDKLADRLNKEQTRGRSDGEFQRDYTRILYASSFRRLQGKMQLLAVKTDQFNRNRLTHSLEVAQIARSIANMIGYEKEEIYVVEACALAHDIGNPPFGHAGERFLNHLCKGFGGFEGNAQTFRLLTTLEQKRWEFQGLNLTARTLLGVLKYYNKFNAELKGKAFEKQKFIYNPDYEIVGKIVKKTGVELRTLDVQIVDLADEIAYAAHDIEDGLRLGGFSTEELLHEFCRNQKDEPSIDMLEKIFSESRTNVGFGNEKVDSSEFSKLYRKEITSKIIYTLIHDIGIVDLSEKEKEKRGTKQKQEIGFVTYKVLAKGLKDTIYQCLTNNNEVYTYEKRGEMMLKDLYHFYNRNPKYLPPEYRKDVLLNQYGTTMGEDEHLQKRLIVDYISGMMDTYVFTEHEKFKDLMEKDEEADICDEKEKETEKMKKEGNDE